MLPKYDLHSIDGAIWDLQISEETFYDFLVKDLALDLIGKNEDEVKQLLVDNDELDSSRQIGNYFDEVMCEQVFGTTHANFVLEHCNSQIDDEEFRGVNRAARALGEDGFEKGKELFSKIKDEFENILESADDVIRGIKSGQVEFDADDALHITVAYALNAEYDFSENGSAKQIIDEFVKSGVSSERIFAEHLEGITSYAANLSINSVYDDLRNEIYPPACAPGSVEEAAALAFYIQQDNEYAGMSRGGPLGTQDIDMRADPAIETRIFREYTDEIVSKMLSLYDPVVVDLELYNEAKALKDTQIADKPESVALIEKNFANIGHKTAPYRSFEPILENAFAAAKNGTLKLDDIKAMAVARDLTHMRTSEMEDYMAIMHPELAKRNFLSQDISKSSMSEIMLGLMEGSSSAKSRLAELKEGLSQRVPEISKALIAFRKELYPEKSLDGPAIR